MNEEPVALKQDATAIPEAETVSGMLLRARHQKGLTLDSVSASLRYSKTFLKALENQQWDILPKGFALRGMVRNYAKLLGLDEEKIMQLLLEETGNGKTQASKTHMVSSVDSKGFPVMPRGSRSRGSLGWLFYVIVVIVVAILVYAFVKGYISFSNIDFKFVSEWFKSK